MKASPTLSPTVRVPWLRSSIAPFGAEIGDDPLALVEVDGDSFIIVIGDLVADQHRRLGERQQPLAMGGDGLAVRRVEVDDRLGVLARHVDRRMDGEAGRRW